LSPQLVSYTILSLFSKFNLSHPFYCWNIGMLRSGHKQEIKIHYKPLEAKVVLSTAVFKFQEGDKTA